MQRLESATKRASENAGGAILCFRVAVFLLYAVMSIVLLVYSFGVGNFECLTRHTYTPKAADSLVSSSMYGSAMLSDAYDATMAMGSHPTDRQPAHGHADARLAMVPVAVFNASEDAAFLEYPAGKAAQLAMTAVGSAEHEAIRSSLTLEVRSRDRPLTRCASGPR